MKWCVTGQGSRWWSSVPLVAVVLAVVATTAHAQLASVTDQVLLIMNRGLMSVLAEPLVDETENPPGRFNAVKPQEFDPGRTHLVQASWLHGTGCPTDATIAVPNATFTEVAAFAPYTDPACTTGDRDDLRNEGLLLFKTGPTSNFASATAELINVKGIVLTELGYDIRKQGPSASALGSHCGAGAPRFNVITSEGFFGIGCNSPPADVQAMGNGWLRLRWGGSAGPLMGFRDFATLEPVVGTVQRIVIVFDEGQDAGPDFFGAAILDNIDVNGKLVGRGAVDAN